MYLLDTNIISYYFDERNVHLRNTISSMDNDLIKISSIVLAELEFGLNKGKPQYRHIKRERIERLTLDFETLNFNATDAMAYGQIRSELENKGQVIGSNDLLIAAQAVANGLILVSNNQNKFNRVSDLALQNWL